MHLKESALETIRSAILLEVRNCVKKARENIVKKDICKHKLNNYVFFLLLVKEMVDMKRSKQIYFRKASKVPSLTPKSVQEISKEHLYRYDNAYTTFKTIRGTAMYYQDTKKKLMATLRQKGAPTLFTTLSCAEFDWNELVQQTYQTINKTKVDIKFIENQDSAWKN